MNPLRYGVAAGVILAGAAPAAGRAEEEILATAVYARVADGYERERLRDGSFKPEYYALSNGGRLDGTAGDNTVDRVGYPQVAELAQRLLARQNYQYARSKEQATLLLVLTWGNTIAWINYKDIPGVTQQLRDKINTDNARVLGYMDALAEMSVFSGVGGPGEDRYTQLLGDVEETRYYIMISAYDFRALSEQGKRQLRWQVRVSVRSPGNNFGDSLIPMLKSASRYFGQDSGKLVQIEESKGTVELGELKFLGEAKEPEKSPTKENE